MITLAQFIVLATYLTIIQKKFGTLQSISHSTYKWKGDEKYYFMLMCWMLAGLNLAQGMEGWGFMTSIGLFFVGITVDFLDNPASSYWLHSIGAVFAIVGGFMGLWILHDIWIPFSVFGVSVVAILLISRTNYVWWIEVSAFLLILTGYTMR